MRKYRYGYMKNVIGYEWFQVQIKRFGIWWDDEHFTSWDDMMDYVNQLKEKGYIVIKI